MSARRFRPTLEALETRDTPSAVQAFSGLNIAVTHLVPPTPISPALSAPVFALNYEYPPGPCLPALINALHEVPPAPIHSPVFAGVEAFLAGGGPTTT